MSNRSAGTGPRKLLRFNTIVRMVQNFVDRTYKLQDSGAVTKVTKDQDAHAVSFSMSDLMAFIRDNGIDPANPDPSHGLRIYLGLHRHTPEEDADMPDRPENYINQHSVILVCTQNGEDLLTNDPTFAGAAGMGLDEGQLCPPPACGAIDALLTS